jgi:type II restriction enzyme
LAHHRANGDTSFIY